MYVVAMKIHFLKNKIMPFVATGRDLERNILIKVSQKRQRQIPYDITSIWNLKYDARERIYETKTDSKTQRTDLWLPRGRGDRGGLDWELEISR